ncbi:MAG: hypothetical protein M3536_04800 [Actinomycetota bacterium]|nr:hypothetical protein [Actinomycetota bacterium]
MLAQKIVQAGTAPTFAAPVLTDVVPMGSLLVVKNGAGASITVTLATVGNLPTGDDYPDKAYTVTAGAERWIPVNQETYRKVDGSGNAGVVFSSVTSITAAAIAQF